ncbi:MAG: DUF547 domain-containing protein [Gammaproteobacteria bacterium]|nr:DUF547 domain-containing protein [Gammaproteobacteria bacterium]
MRKFIPFSLFCILSLGFSSSLIAESPLASDQLHEPFSQLLAETVDNGHVDYSKIKGDVRFGNYLKALQQTRPENYATQEEKLAFWINAYNALAIKGIIDGLSPSSFFGRVSYFKTTDYEVAGKSINLYDLERDIIIPFDEPRIHFAIVCASYSCPKLRAEAYLADTLEAQLEDNAIDFLNDPVKNSFDVKKKRANLSKIFDWFEKDFKSHSGSVQKYVAQFVKDNGIKSALMNEDYKVKHLKYQWTLNGSLDN